MAQDSGASLSVALPALVLILMVRHRGRGDWVNSGGHPSSLPRIHRHSPEMDALRAELAAAKAKRRPGSDGSPSTEAESSSTTGSSKYIRRKDILRQQELERQRAEEQEANERAAKRQRLSSTTAASGSRASGSGTRNGSSSAAAGSSTSTAADQARDEALEEAAKDALATAIKESSTDTAAATATPAFNISPEEAIRRLRAKGQPIRLFGESDKDRRLRLRALELLEERGTSVGGQNDFMRALAKAGQDHRDSVAGADPTVASPAAGNDDGSGTPRVAPGDGNGTGEGGADAGTSANASSSSKPKEGVGMDQVLDLTLIKRDPNKLYPIIYHTLKGLLKDWEKALADRPEDVRRSTQGKLAAATQVQAAEYLQPLFKLLRKRDLAPDVLARLSEIVHYVQKREYRHANDSYLQLSIGNAPWPIGVTMVGIHERSGREKIFSSNVAHVLNDEVSRKYIQSLKRLMTFSQTKYPPSSTAMLMG